MEGDILCMKLKKIINDQKTKNYKINISLYSSLNKNEFLVGDKVINTKYNLKGRVSKIESDILLITYDDKTIERINKNDALKVLSYVDDIQNIIDPMSPQISKNKIKKVINNLSESQELFEEQKIDKQKMKINEEYEKMKLNKENSLKESKIENLINLGISKGLIDKDEFDLEKTKLLMMDENDYKEYEDNIVNFNSKSIVTSKNNQEIDPNLTEAERALLEIKNGNNVIASNIDFDKISNDSRDLSTISKKSNSNVMINNMSEDYSQYQYNQNKWMNDLDWTTLSWN